MILYLFVMTGIRRNILIRPRGGESEFNEKIEFSYTWKPLWSYKRNFFFFFNSLYPKRFALVRFHRGNYKSRILFYFLFLWCVQKIFIAICSQKCFSFHVTAYSNNTVFLLSSARLKYCLFRQIFRHKSLTNDCAPRFKHWHFQQ